MLFYLRQCCGGVGDFALAIHCTLYTVWILYVQTHGVCSHVNTGRDIFLPESSVSYRGSLLWIGLYLISTPAIKNAKENWLFSFPFCGTVYSAVNQPFCHCLLGELSREFSSIFLCNNDNVMLLWHRKELSGKLSHSTFLHNLKNSISSLYCSTFLLLSTAGNICMALCNATTLRIMGLNQWRRRRRRRDTCVFSFPRYAASKHFYSISHRAYLCTVQYMRM